MNVMSEGGRVVCRTNKMELLFLMVGHVWQVRKSVQKSFRCSVWVVHDSTVAIF